MSGLWGFLFFLLLPFGLYILHTSLRSEVSFAQLQQTMVHPEMRFLLWVLLSAVSFHFLAGIRHMLMDCGLGETLGTARFTAYFLMLLAGIVVVFVGVWLC